MDQPLHSGFCTRVNEAAKPDYADDDDEWERNNDYAGVTYSFVHCGIWISDANHLAQFNTESRAY